MFCDRCGSEIPNDSLFCPNCGNAVGQGSGDMRNTAYRNYNLGNVPGNYPNAQMQVKPKKSKAPFIIVGAAVIVAVAAVIAAVMFLNKPYMKPIDKVYQAYNKVDNDLLYEAVTVDLYGEWDLQASHEVSPSQVSYKVLNKKHVKGSELFEYASAYGAKDCYIVVMRDKLPMVYSSDDIYDYDGYGVNTFTVCKINGEWKVCNVY